MVETWTSGESQTEGEDRVGAGRRPPSAEDPSPAFYLQQPKSASLLLICSWQCWARFCLKWDSAALKQSTSDSLNWGAWSCGGRDIRKFFLLSGQAEKLAAKTVTQRVVTLQRTLKTKPHMQWQDLVDWSRRQRVGGPTTCWKGSPPEMKGTKVNLNGKDCSFLRDSDIQ